MKECARVHSGGFTLVELVLSIGVMTALLVAVGGFVHACLKAETSRQGVFALYGEGSLAMERMVAGVKGCTYLHVPNNHNASRDALAFSRSVNSDGDFYLGDNLLACVDEDLPGDMSDDSAPGIVGFDDDGDGAIDEPDGMVWSDAVKDDDEDGGFDEDWLDGRDNDKDGNIDEDVPSDANADNMPGIGIFDDDADAAVDEGAPGSITDDDEDGALDEDGVDPVIYVLDGGTGTLQELFPSTGACGVFCENVTAFVVTYHAPDCDSDPFVTISLTLTGDDGESVTLQEDVYPRNIVQRCGKRVR